jgi:hypothetical protein
MYYCTSTCDEVNKIKVTEVQVTQSAKTCGVTATRIRPPLQNVVPNIRERERSEGKIREKKRLEHNVRSSETSTSMMVFVKGF